MKRRAFLTSTLLVASVPRGFVFAQGGGRTVRLGLLTAQQASSLAPYVEVFRASLAELGYVEGRNLAIEYRYGDDAIERVPALAAELLSARVDVMVVQGAAVSEVRMLGLPVPVVYLFSGDPVTAGFADSLARPRGNMTGLTFMWAEFNGKRLELLREIIPELRRVAIIANPQHPGEHLERAASEAAAQRLGIALEYFPTRSADELTAAFGAMAADPPHAISLFADGFATQNRARIIDFATSQRVPAVSGWPIFAQSGALFTYGPELRESYRQLAFYVDRIVRGAKPADLPIEQPTRFHFAINLRTAKALDLSIPTSLLARADEIIE